MTKKYLNVITQQQIIVYPWTSENIKTEIKNNPQKYMELFEESA